MSGRSAAMNIKLPTIVRYRPCPVGPSRGFSSGTLDSDRTPGECTGLQFSKPAQDHGLRSFHTRTGAWCPCSFTHARPGKNRTSAGSIARGASPTDDVRSCSRQTAYFSKHCVIVRSSTTFDSITLFVTRSTSRCWCPASFPSCNGTIDQPRHKIRRFVQLSVPFDCLRTSFHSPYPDHSSSFANKMFICLRRSSQPNAKIPRRTQFALLGSSLLCKDSLIKIE